MRKIIITSLLILLSACTSTDKLVPKFEFPTPPEKLMVPPQPLQQITPPVKKLVTGVKNV